MDKTILFSFQNNVAIFLFLYLDPTKKMLYNLNEFFCMSSCLIKGLNLFSLQKVLSKSASQHKPKIENIAKIAFIFYDQIDNISLISSRNQIKSYEYLYELRCMLINIKRKCIMGFLSMITVDSWCDTVILYVLSYTLQLMKRSVFKIEESA